MQLFLHCFQNFLALFMFQLVASAPGYGKRPMKGLVAVLLIIALSTGLEINGEDNRGPCEQKTLNARPHSVSILEFGAVGDGKTLNTVAFQNAIFYLKSFTDKGGAQLYVPSGKWLTGSFNLTSHLTLFLERGATMIASQDFAHWDVVDSLPSYGRGIDVPGGRYRSLIYGQNLSDVVITGRDSIPLPCCCLLNVYLIGRALQFSLTKMDIYLINLLGDSGIIDGQGSIWWDLFNSHSLNHSRPHLVEFVNSVNVTISNLTFLNSPAWDIHPVYCSNVQILNITTHAPAESPYTSGIVPDSSQYVCIEKSNISSGHDAIVLKSGWDQYGIAYGKPTSGVHIRDVYLQSSSGAGLSFGSEMSGGISDITAEQLHVLNSHIGIQLKTTIGRGGYMKGIFISDAELVNIDLGIRVTGDTGFHPDDKYDPSELPVVDSITFKNITGSKITIPGNFSGLNDSPFTKICLSKVNISVSSEPSSLWFCSNVKGFSEDVFPEPCPELQSSYSEFSSCFSSLYSLSSYVSSPFNHHHQQPQES